MKRRLPFLTLALLAALLPGTARADRVRLERLTTMFGDFQEGFVFWGQCGDFKREKAAHPRYLNNWEAVVATYAHEIRVEHPDVSAEDIQRAIFKKSNDVKNGAIALYKDKSACTSPATEGVRKNIAMFDNQPTKSMIALLNDIGK